MKWVFLAKPPFFKKMKLSLSLNYANIVLSRKYNNIKAILDFYFIVNWDKWSYLQIVFMRDKKKWCNSIGILQTSKKINVQEKKYIIDLFDDFNPNKKFNLKNKGFDKVSLCG